MLLFSSTPYEGDQAVQDEAPSYGSVVWAILRISLNGYLRQKIEASLQFPNRTLPGEYSEVYLVGINFDYAERNISEFLVELCDGAL